MVPGPPYARGMALAWEQVIVHAIDPVALGTWWAEALGWSVVYSDDDEFEIRPEPDKQPALDFVRVDEPKQGKSRLHLDFRPDDQDAEVARLLAHGAQRVDIGQGEQSWVVLADPEGNEFCVLAARVR
ncbi:VOC family protein [Humibacter ginsengisoli]